jgi:hypothetical protein
MDEATTLVTVRPRESLARAGLVAGLVAGVPLFGVLYWLSASQGSWRRVLVIHVLIVGISAFAWIRYTGSYTEVTTDRLIKQAFFKRRVVDRERIASTVIGQTWRPGSSETVPQLLALDRDGQCLTRLRGAYWSLESMQTIAGALGVPCAMESHPVTLKEFYEEHPHAAYWYEGKAWVGIVGVVAAFAGAFVVVSWIMMAIGSHSLFSLTP